MTHLQIEFASPSWRFDQAKAPSEEARSIGNQRESWRRECWLPYQRGQIGARVRVHRFTCGVSAHGGAEPLASDKLELPLDDYLFDSVLDLYAKYGSPGMQAAGKGGQLTGFDRAFLIKTLARIDNLIGRELIAIQAQASILARQENAQFAASVGEHIKKFGFNAGYQSPELQLDKDVLYTKVRDFHRLQLRIARQKVAADERFQKDGGDNATVLRRRARDEYRRLLAEQAEKPMRETQTALNSLCMEIAAVFSPALLILDEVEDDLIEWMTKTEYARSKSDFRRKRSKEVELKYDRKILRALNEMKSALDATKTSLFNPGVESRLLALRGSSSADKFAAGGSHTVVMDFALEKRPGIASTIKDGVVTGLFGLYFTRDALEDYALANRVLGSPSVLRRLLSEVETTLPNSLRRAVLMHHCLELEARLKREKLDAKFYESIWHYFQVVAAGASLLLAVLSIPFGAGAVGVPAALSAFLAVLGIASAVLGVIVMVGSVLKLVGKALDADDDLSRQLLHLGYWDAEALDHLGSMLSSHHEVTKALTTGMLGEMVKLAAAHKLRPVAFALDMQGYLDDMETLSDFDGSESSGSEAARP